MTRRATDRLFATAEWLESLSFPPPPLKKTTLATFPGCFIFLLGASRSVWDSAPRGLFDVEDEPFEVFAFRMVDVDRVVGRLGELVQNTDVATGNGCC